MTKRIACSIPFCARTGKVAKGDDEVICSSHWKMVPIERKRAYGRAKRRFAKHPNQSSFDVMPTLWIWCKEKCLP